MTTDSTLQELRAAVEELRIRVERLEQDGNHQDSQPELVASMTSNRKTFHLRGCKFTKGFMASEGGYYEFRTHDDAVGAGLVPCKSCFA